MIYIAENAASAIAFGLISLQFGYHHQVNRLNPAQNTKYLLNRTELKINSSITNIDNEHDSAKGCFYREKERELACVLYVVLCSRTFTASESISPSRNLSRSFYCPQLRDK